jgi:hypothetical protein
MWAFQPQNPRSTDANTMLDKNAKCPSPALVDTEGTLGFDAAMGTGLAVKSVFSGLHLSRVVLDFLFCCHNLEVDVLLGARRDRSTVRCGPLFHLPKRRKNHDRPRAKKRGRGPILRKTRAGSKQGCLRGGIPSQRKTRLTSNPRLR